MLAQEAAERVAADPAQEARVSAQPREADRDVARGPAWPGVEPMRLPGLHYTVPGDQVDKRLTRHHDHGGVSPEPRGISEVRK
jgi:hypothetical protein